MIFFYQITLITLVHIILKTLYIFLQTELTRHKKIKLLEMYYFMPSKKNLKMKLTKNMLIIGSCHRVK